MVRKLLALSLLLSLTQGCAGQSLTMALRNPVFVGEGGISYEFDLQKGVAWDLDADYGVDLKAVKFLGNPCISMDQVLLCHLRFESQKTRNKKITFVGESQLETADGTAISAREYHLNTGAQTFVQWSTSDGKIVAFSLPSAGGVERVRYVARSRLDFLDIFSLTP